MGMTPFGLELPAAAAALGVIVGMTYGLLGGGLVLVYRSNRIINFAHGEIGAFAAAFFTLLTLRWSLPYWVAFPLAMLVGAAVGAICEIVVVRRLRAAPRVMSIVGTLGVGQFLLGLSAAVSVHQTGATFPVPPGVPVFDIGALRVTEAHTTMLLLAPILVAAIATFLVKSRVGIAMRAAAANPDAARMAAISPSRMSALAWALAGGVSAFTAVLVAPSLGITTGDSFGPGLLLRALTVAVVAGMTSLPLALAAGVGLGILEQLLLWNYPRSGLVEVMLFVVILAVLLLRRSQGTREDEKGSWAAVTGLKPIPDAVRAIPVVRRLGLIAALASLAIALLLPLVVSHSASITLVTIIAFAIVGLSISVLTGYAGQLSLGQFGLAAVGATVSYHVAFRTGNFALAVLYAGLSAAGVALVIGLPALRVRGLLLAVTTLGFALVVPSWLLPQSWMLGDGVIPGRPIVLGRALEGGKDYYFFALALLVLTFLLVHNIRRSGFARLLVAVRDNEDNARAFTVAAGTVKIQSFLIAGFIAGIGGAVYGHTLARLSVTPFLTTESINVVMLTVIGGLGLIAGPLLGALYLIGVPAFLPLDAAGLAATRFGALILVLYLPGGLAHVVQPVRDRVVAWIARRHGIATGGGEGPVSVDEGIPTSAPAGAPVAASRLAAAARPRPQVVGTPLLEAENLVKRFGGVHAVDGVSMNVFAGQTVGLIGPNGAGKTTLFEMLSGFTRPDSGQVVFAGAGIGGLRPDQRAKLGLIRSFQDAALFPTMTVRATISVALERRRPTSFASAIAGFTGAERARLAEADELIAYMGLGAYKHEQIQDLSTGTRRIVELTCAIGLQPALLLLDEPAAGIAQRETEALGTLLRELKRDFSMTLVVIEHDIPLIMDLADHIVAMDAGQVIAEGKPSYVRHHPTVIEAYLGGSIEAIERSGPAKPNLRVEQ